jgi:hypothetical protein
VNLRIYNIGSFHSDFETFDIEIREVYIVQYNAKYIQGITILIQQFELYILDHRFPNFFSVEPLKR